VNDRAFLAAFEAAAIPSERWRHRDHIRVAYLYLRDHPFEAAIARIRNGIRALNGANGVKTTATSGYHETVTVAWAHVVAAGIAHHGAAADFEAFAAENPHLCAKSLLRLYYTRARIFTPEARERFVEPDLEPLPRIVT
jgi:hypothetical protein